MTPPRPSRYAPQRTKPLSLLNPLDYLTLIYWALYFPQGLRWYVETFSGMPVTAQLRRVLFKDSVQTKLFFQTILFAFPLSYLAFVDLQEPKIPIWVILVLFVAFIVMMYFVEISRFIVLLISLLFVMCKITIVAFVIENLSIKKNINNKYDIFLLTAFFVISIFLLGSIIGNFYSILRNTSLSVTKFRINNIKFDQYSFGVIFLASFVLVIYLILNNGNILSNLLIMAAGMLGFMYSGLNYSGLLISIFYKYPRNIINASPSGINRSKKYLDKNLSENWMGNIKLIEEYIPFCLQHLKIKAAIGNSLSQISTEKLLTHISDWCSLPLYDWNIVLAQSTSVGARTWDLFWSDTFPIPRKWRPKTRAIPDYSTPAGAACAAFWYLNEGDVKSSLGGFAAVRSLPHGEELHANAAAMAAAQEIADIAAIPGWQPPAPGAETLLRPQVRAALEQLGLAAQNIGLVLESRSPLQRSTALNRATGILNTLKDGLEDCPTPERPILRAIAAAWLELALDQASAIGTVEVRERVASPYTVGAVVAPERLIGRQDIFARIQQIWDKPGRRDSLVIYGQRRIGKSSIVRNLAHFCRFSDETGLAVLNIQAVDWERGLVDLCFQIGFELWRALPSDLAEPQFEDFERRPLIALRGLLVALNREHPERRYILILDEYEELEHNLPPAIGGEFIRMLRGWTQNYPWLVAALVGLHTLQERSADYFAPIFSWRPIPVGLMDADAVADMLQVQDDEFPLSYSPAALAMVHRLTGGQPLLVQLIGDTLVEHFNRRLLDPGPPPDSMLEGDDLTRALHDNPQFEADSAVYFQGIWRQSAHAPPGQHAILRALAPRAGLAGPFFSLRSTPPILTQAELYASAPAAELQAASGLDPDTFAPALDALKRHDIVVERDGYVSYTVELMRRWVAGGGPDAR